MSAAIELECDHVVLLYGLVAEGTAVRTVAEEKSLHGSEVNIYAVLTGKSGVVAIEAASPYFDIGLYARRREHDAANLYYLVDANPYHAVGNHPDLTIDTDTLYSAREVLGQALHLSVDNQVKALLFGTHNDGTAGGWCGNGAGGAACGKR